VLDVNNGNRRRCCDQGEETNGADRHRISGRQGGRDNPADGGNKNQRGDGILLNLPTGFHAFLWGFCAALACGTCDLGEWCVVLIGHFFCFRVLGLVLEGRPLDRLARGLLRGCGVKSDQRGSDVIAAVGKGFNMALAKIQILEGAQDNATACCQGGGVHG
jgi:hypothetical protein